MLPFYDLQQKDSPTPGGVFHYPSGQAAGEPPHPSLHLAPESARLIANVRTGVVGACLVLDAASIGPAVHRYINSLHFDGLFYVGKVIRSYQYIFLQNILHFFRFFKQWRVSRLLECVKSFHWRS